MAQQEMGWIDLHCDSCGGDRFAVITGLRWKQSGGTSGVQHGYWCLECHAVADIGRMIDQAKLASKKAELKALQEEIGETAPVAKD